MKTLLQKLGVPRAIIQAPMAGGPDSPELAAAVAEAGGLGSLGCAYLFPEQIDAAVEKTRRLTKRPFALNLFIRDDVAEDAAATQRAKHVLTPFRRELGLPEAPSLPKPPPSFSEQLAAVLRARPAVFSFTFGLPSAAVIQELRAAGTVSVGTATSLDEAEALVALGVDAVCAQGCEAGGHRGTFLGPAEEALIGTLALTRQLVARVPVPVIAAGGIMDGAGIRAALELGAQAAQLGTAFMLCPEAGTHAHHRSELTSLFARRTVITKAFTGRAARAIRNRFTEAFDAVDVPPFPHQQALTADLRAAAAAQGRRDLMQLWAGQGAPLIRAMPAAELVQTLAKEARLS